MNTWIRQCASPFTAACSAVLLAVGLFGSVRARAETFTLDPAHTRIGFAVGHMGLSTVRGRFTNYTGHVEINNGDVSTLSASATVYAASIETGMEARDNHLLGPDFFNVKKYPEIRFVARDMKKKKKQWRLRGEFIMHGTTNTLSLPVKVNGPIDDPWGNRRIGLQAETVIHRHDYGVGSDKLSDEMVGDEVTLEIDIEATAAKDE